MTQGHLPPAASLRAARWGRYVGRANGRENVLAAADDAAALRRAGDAVIERVRSLHDGVERYGSGDTVL
jgi:hypothetical protein